MSERTNGKLHLDLISNGNVSFLFTPQQGAGFADSPLLCKNVDMAEDDLVRTWNFTPNKAQAAIEELKLRKHVERDV
jgi:hypothetical protein